MEKLLFGILSSDKPLSLKKTFALQIAGAGKGRGIEYEAFSNMLNHCMYHIFDEKVQLNHHSKEIVLDVIKGWIQNIELIERYMEEKLSITKYKELTLKNKITFFEELLLILKSLSETKQKIPNLSKFQLFCYEAFMCVSDLKEFSLVCFTYIECPFLLPKELKLSDVQNVGAVFVKVLSDTSISDYINYEKHEARKLKCIFILMSMLIEKDEHFVNIVASKIFKVLMDNVSAQPSICISKYLNYLNLDKVSLYINQAIQSNLSDDQLTLMTSRLIDWICFPDPQLATDQWIMQVFKYFLQQKKYQVLFTVIEGKIIQVCIILYFAFIFLC